VEILFSIIRRQ